MVIASRLKDIAPFKDEIGDRKGHAISQKNYFKSVSGDTLSIHCFVHADQFVIQATGVITLGTVDALRKALRASVDSGLPMLIVDLRLTTFLGASGLNLLVDASKRLRTPETPQAPTVLVTPGQQPARVLKIGAYERILKIVFQLDDEPASANVPLDHPHPA